MAPRKPRTGVDDYDYIQQIRDSAKKAYKLAVNARDTYYLEQGKVQPTPFGMMTDPKTAKKIQDFEENYINPIRVSRGELGRLAGSSKGQGIVQKSVSPGIQRDPNTGSRLKAGKAIGPEYLLDKAGGSSPAIKASSYLSSNEAVLTTRAKAKAIGSDVSREIGRIRKAVAALGEQAYKEYKLPREKFMEVAGPSYGNRDRSKVGGTSVVRTRATFNEPVNPSVKVKKPLPKSPKLGGSSIEPITGKGSVPDVFKKAFNSGFTAGLGPIGILSSGIDELFQLDRARSGSGGGGIQKDKNKAL